MRLNPDGGRRRRVERNATDATQMAISQNAFKGCQLCDLSGGVLPSRIRRANAEIWRVVTHLLLLIAVEYRATFML
jgi:hypothetical protein